MMGRTKEAKNKNFYHYKVTEYDNDNNILTENKFINLYQVSENYNCSRRLATYHLKKDNIDKILSAVGSQDPIGNLIDVNFDKWENSIIINAINQIRCIIGLYKNNRKKMNC